MPIAPIATSASPTAATAAGTATATQRSIRVCSESSHFRPRSPHVVVARSTIAGIYAGAGQFGSTRCRHLGEAFRAASCVKDPLARDFYAEMCRIERWDVRTFRQKIGGMLFQRTALSKNSSAAAWVIPVNPAPVQRVKLAGSACPPPRAATGAGGPRSR